MAGDSLQSSLRNSSSSRLLTALNAVKLHIESNNAGVEDSPPVSDLVSQLESDDHSICSRLDSRLYRTIIQTLLQVKASHESERAIHLLGAALYYDTLCAAKARTVKNKKDAIGKDCLGLLLEFFMDGSKRSSMRQWVGILTLQLFQNCDSNVQVFELGPEKQRRELGNFLVEEPNEILRIICGQLITALLTAGVLPEHLWPIDADKRLYTTFPTVALGSRGWNQQFQDYMDNIFDITEQNDSLGQLYFTQNVSLAPQHDFGPEDHNVVVVIDREQMIIWTGVVADIQNFNHCLEIPLGKIQRILIKSRSDSQLRGVLNVYLFLENTDGDCYLNCIGTTISQICMVLQQAVVDTMRDDLHRIRPCLKIVDDEAVDKQDELKHTQHTSQTSEALKFHNNGISVVRLPLNSPTHNLVSEEDPGEHIEMDSKHTSEPKENFEIGSSLVPSRGGIEIKKGPIVDTSLSSPGMKNGCSTMHLNEPKKCKTATGRKRVLSLKPKAKPPLRRAQKSIAGGRQWQSHLEPSPFSHTGPVKGLSYDEIEAYATKLASQFPSTDISTRRGMVLTSNGNLENAVNLLAQKSTDRVSSEERLNQQPKVNNDMKMSALASEESSKVRNHTKGSTRKRQRRATMATAEATIMKSVTPRRYSLKQTLDVLDNDDKCCYDIPPDEMQPDSPKTGEKNAAANTKSVLSSSTRRKTTVKEGFTESAKGSKCNPKKRHSAPAALEQVNTRRMGQRQAAVAARKKLTEHNSSDIEHQFNEDLESKISKHIQKNTKGANADDKERIEPMPSDPSVLGQEKLIVQLQQNDQRDIGLLVSSEDNLPLKLSDDLYGASPIRPQVNIPPKDGLLKWPFDDLYDATPIKATTGAVQSNDSLQDGFSYSSLPRKNDQILGRMAARMNSLLGGLNEPDEIEDISKSKAKERRIHRPKIASSVSPDRPLVNDYLLRKTPVVAFNEKGPRNQGLVGLHTASNHLSNAHLDNLAPTQAECEGDRKRKREVADNKEFNTPLRKRQSLSPNITRTPITGNEECFQSSPPHVIESDNKNPDSYRNISFVDTNPARDSKYGSQLSRVDKNGSPLATRSSQIDRISDAKRKLLDDADSEEVRTPQLAYTSPLYDTVSPEIFGPRLRLGSLPKSRPSSSLEDTASRYIPHKKTRNGYYKGLGTNEIIAPEMVLLDPFIDKDVSRPINDFSDRLLAGSSGSITGCRRVPENMHHGDRNHPNMQAKAYPTNLNQKIGLKNISTTRRVPKRLTGVFVNEDDDTLIEPINRSSSDKHSMPEMTTDSSCTLRSPLAEKSKAWNMAVRPHYANLADTIHQIADEVIIRLADEEDAIQLIANQYKENGEKLLSQAAHKRSEEKAVITSELDQKQREMAALYADAKGLVDRTKQSLKISPLSAVDKQWRVRCDAVQEQINKEKTISKGG